MILARTADECDLGPRDWKRSARRNGKRQPAQAGPIRCQLLLRPRGHYGPGALVRELPRLRQAGADGRPGRHRVHAADRALEGLWRRHRLPGCDVGDGDLGLRALGQNRAARCVRNRACAADSLPPRSLSPPTTSAFGLNLVCGWNEGDFEMFGATLRDHEARYDYAQEWLDIVKLVPLPTPTSIRPLLRLLSSASRTARAAPGGGTAAVRPRSRSGSSRCAIFRPAPLREWRA